MTPNQLADLDEVVGRMTDGDWQTRFIYRLFKSCRDNQEYLKLLMDSGGSKQDWADAEGIVALRNSYSLLRDHIKALESKVKELEGK